MPPECCEWITGAEYTLQSPIDVSFPLSYRMRRALQPCNQGDLRENHRDLRRPLNGRVTECVLCKICENGMVNMCVCLYGSRIHFGNTECKKKRLNISHVCRCHQQFSYTFCHFHFLFLPKVWLTTTTLVECIKRCLVFVCLFVFSLI